MYQACGTSHALLETYLQHVHAMNTLLAVSILREGNRSVAGEITPRGAAMRRFGVFLAVIVI